MFKGNAEPEIRVVRYWDIIYPRYNSFLGDPKNKRFRRMPEFLAPFTMGTFPAKEPQRFLLTFHLPGNGTREIRGDVFVWHAGSVKALKLPVSVTVLPFRLKQDPNKHFSAYNIPIRRDKIPFYRAHKEDKELVHKVVVNEFRTMRDYGFTRPPIFLYSLSRLPDGTKDAFWSPHLDEYIAELKEAGFPADCKIALAGGSSMDFYRQMTGLPLSFHMMDIQCDKIPEELYTRMESALDKFLAYAKKKNYPEFIFNPVDEPDPAAFSYVKRIFEIYRKKGLKTFLTSPPERFRKEADHLFDIYNFGAFHASYEEATSGKKAEYWCYPNDNAYQYKDPDMMCHGGRMTYGYGFWRSGFHCLMPWIWRKENTARLGNHGGVLLLEDGRLFMTTYWECFRLGVDDLRYLYTLEDAVVKRENSSDPACRKAVADAKALLQKTWNAIAPQSAYLRLNLMPHAELDGRRAELANAICVLSAFKESDPKAVASSVIIDPRGKYQAPAPAESPNRMELPLKKWLPVAKELSMQEIPSGMDVTVKVDHEFEGEIYHGQQHYPIGWPRIQANFKKPGLDCNNYDSLEFDLTVHSDRDVENDYKWPLVAVLKSADGKSGSLQFATSLEPNVKHKIRIPLTSFRTLGREELKQISTIQIVVFENKFPDKVTLHLKIENPLLSGYKAPTVTDLAVPEVLALPVQGFSVPTQVIGATSEEGVTARCSLLDTKGRTVQRADLPVCGNRVFCGFSGKDLKPGKYLVRIALQNKKGAVTSELSRSFRVIAGPGMAPASR